MGRLRCLVVTARTERAVTSATSRYGRSFTKHGHTLRHPIGFTFIENNRANDSARASANHPRGNGIFRDGVVGQVVAVSTHAARVMLVADTNSGVDVLVQRSRVQGIAAGAIENGCILKYVQRGSDVAVGDTVITSGLDGIFPKGYPVGAITRVDARESRMFQEVEVKLSADLARVEEVLVVPPPAVRAGE